MRSDLDDQAYAEFAAARQPVLRRLAYALDADWRRAHEGVGTALARLYVVWPRARRQGAEEQLARQLLLRAARGPRRTPSESAGGNPVVARLQALPEAERRVVLLRHGVGLSAQETAGELGLSLAAVAQLEARAVRSLGPHDDLATLLGTPLPGEPPPRPVEEVLEAGRRALRRRRRAAVAGSVAAVAALGLSPLLLLGGAAGGGGIDTPSPVPSTTPVPGHVRLLVAPPSDVHAGTPPVLYLFGRMYRRDRGVDVLAAFGDVDQAAHPRGAAIVRVAGRTSWVLVAGNEPRSIHQQRSAPYDYSGFVAWASARFHAVTGHLALAATAPGPFHPPVPDAASPAVFAGDLLVAKPGGSVVQRDRNPVRDAWAVRSCHVQAVRIHTAGGDWFVLGAGCPDGHGVLYSERVGVRATTLSSWLVQVRRVQDQFVR